MAEGNSKKPRRAPHSGRSRGSQIKTGNRGARRTALTHGQLALMGKGPVAAIRPVYCAPWMGA